MTTSRHTRWSRVVWRAVCRAAAALRHIHDQQTLMWELQWQANRAAVPETGALAWMRTLDGHRLAGSHLPVPDHTGAGGAS